MAPSLRPRLAPPRRLSPQPTSAPPNVDNWARESENFSARAPDSSSFWPFAVIAHKGELDPDLALLRQHVGLALDLGPRFLVLVSDAVVTPDGRFSHGGRKADFGPDSIPVPVFLCPGAYGRSSFRIPCDRFGAIAFAHLQEGGLLDLGHVERIREATLLIVDRGTQEGGSGGDAYGGLTSGGELRRGAIVLAVGGDRFTWERRSGFEVLTVPWLRREATPDGGVVSEGRFPGIVWGAFNGGDVSVRIVRLSGAVTPSRVARSFQEERARLRETFSASSIWAGHPATTVSCTNVTDGPLRFDARWEFSRGGIAVDPQILAFRLGPGEDFKQEFRFALPQGVPLKDVAPVFVCRTVVPDGDGRPTPLMIRVAPRCVAPGGP